MISSAAPTFPAELLARITAFESALGRDPAADFADFLPPHDHPLYLAVLGELVRIDLVTAWAGPQPRRLPDYWGRFPSLFENRTVLRAVALEEYRQRRQRGELTTPDEYQAVYRIDTRDWPTIDSEPPAAPTEHVSLHQTPFPATDRVAVRPAVEEVRPERLFTPESSADWSETAPRFPEPGTKFLGFRLMEELGRGTFGRVYLAQQGDLGGRLVALKVATNIFGESQTLAQLQHTNIVPIYSFHQIGPVQAVCMPFFGRTTLAQVVQRLSDRPSLPSSGRELVSTVNRRGTDSTRTGNSSVRPAIDPLPVPLPAEAPAAEHLAEGWARLEGLSYVEAVLWLGGQLADGLAHAHQRGILHRDLKPANILLTDDGRPMLLDFNLAEDTKTRSAAERAAVGGTLPYMAPEHIRAFITRTGVLDERADLFGLGVILFELLTGRHPYPIRSGQNIRETATAMLADRQQPPPSVRQWNPAISPAAEAIIHKCLAPNAAERYAKAEHLREDIDRQLNNLPLKHAPNPSLSERLGKWARRHPRFTSSAAVAAVATVLLLAVGAGAIYSRERSRNLQAQATFTDHQREFIDARLFIDDRTQLRPHTDEGLARLQAVLARYGVPADGEDAGWLTSGPVHRLSEVDREQLRADVGEIFYRMAQVEYMKATANADAKAAHLDLAARWNAVAERYAADQFPRALREQRAAIAELRGQSDEAKRLREGAAPPESARDLYLLGAHLAQKCRYREALTHLQRSTQLDPKNFSAWFVRGGVHHALRQDELAAMSFGACLALRDDFAPAWANRGRAFHQLRFFDLAIEDFDRTLKLDPNWTEVYVQRADAKYARRDLAGAEEDLTRALNTGKAPVRIHFLRANIRERRGDQAGQKADREAGLALTPTDEWDWIGRAEQRAESDPKGALADTEEALKINPFALDGLQMKAHLLDRLNRPEEALAVLDRAVSFYPDSAPARAGRGVLLARQGKRDAALRDAQHAILMDTRAPNQYQVGCIYALTSKTHPEDKTEAFRYLWSALRTGYGLDLVDTDTDLDPVRADPRFQQLVKKAKELHPTQKP